MSIKRFFGKVVGFRENLRNSMIKEFNADRNGCIGGADYLISMLAVHLYTAVPVYVIWLGLGDFPGGSDKIIIASISALAIFAMPSVKITMFNKFNVNSHLLYLAMLGSWYSSVAYMLDNFLMEFMDFPPLHLATFVGTMICSVLIFGGLNNPSLAKVKL